MVDTYPALLEYSAPAGDIATAYLPAMLLLLPLLAEAAVA